MPEQLFKLSPDRDLQCYFLTPSAIAAMSGATPTGFTLSGSWRQQFDWAVVEWNRDNTFEHPALRYLPDGDLSGLTLTYEEERSGCIPIESNLYPVVDWDKLRIWATDNQGNEQVYPVSLLPCATSIEGASVPASATMTLLASPGTGMRVGFSCLEEQHYYLVGQNDSLEVIAAGIASDVNNTGRLFTATSAGAAITVTWNPRSGLTTPNLYGANGNRINLYGLSDAGSKVWQEPTATFAGGQFPSKYSIEIDFGKLKAQGIPTDKVRKLRWTWSTDLQAGSFQRTSFHTIISNWTVTGSNRIYSVAGPGSRRIEDNDSSVKYLGSWTSEIGNYSGSTIQVTSTVGDSCTLSYGESAQHDLYLGTRCLGPTQNVTFGGARINVDVDGQILSPSNLLLNGEDVLVRIPLGSYGAGNHTISVTHAGLQGYSYYFDFLEIAYPSSNLPDFVSQPQLALATDWDTYHSQSLPAERTAWIINKLGFMGRLYHYTGALWFYELVSAEAQYASLILSLTPESDPANKMIVLDIAPDGISKPTLVQHLISPLDTAETVTAGLAALINTAGYNLVWASANGNQLTLTARAIGSSGNVITISLDATSQGYTFSAPSTTLSGGVDGVPWQTDLSAMPRLNKAASDWHLAYFTALKGYGIDVVAAFSTELGNGDPSEQAGIAQRRWDGTPVIVNTPATQTNFSPASLTFWTQVYLDMAALQYAAGVIPYLCSGEVQWWYYPYNNPSDSKELPVSMPFYDDYTKQQFLAKYGVSIQEIVDSTVNPTSFPNEAAFLPALIGTYTAAIRGALQGKYPNCRYEVLYPTDTNDTDLNRQVNFPSADWTPANLTCLKTESFTFTGNRDLDQCLTSMSVSAAKGFPNNQRSHLVGIGDASTPWMKEVGLAFSQGLESIVLFALDQYCLIGYPAPPFANQSQSKMQG